MSDKEDCNSCSVVTQNKEYIEAIELYYNERLNSQLKDKFSRCADCNEKKQFIDKQGQLIYSCGSKSGKCGVQMTIDLAKYCYYPEMKKDATRILNSLMDLSQFKDLFLQKEIDKQSATKQKNEKVLKKCKEPFSKQNNIKERENRIKKTHRDRIQGKKDQNILLSKIREEEDDDKKHTLMKEYIQINQRLKEEYEELITSNKPLNQFLVVEEGKVTKHESTYKEMKKKEKKEKKDKKEVEEEPEPAPAPEEPKFKKGDQVEWLEKGKQTTGTIDKIVTKDGKEIAEITTSDGKDITKAISNIKILE